MDTEMKKGPEVHRKNGHECGMGQNEIRPRCSFQGRSHKTKYVQHIFWQLGCFVEESRCQTDLTAIQTCHPLKRFVPLWRKKYAKGAPSQGSGIFSLATLWGDDPQVRLTAVDHLRAGWRWRLSRDYFPQAVAIGYREEAWGGPGTDVAISWRETNKESEVQCRGSVEEGCVFVCFDAFYVSTCELVTFCACLPGCVYSALHACVRELSLVSWSLCRTTCSSLFLYLKQLFSLQDDSLQLLHIKTMSWSLQIYVISLFPCSHSLSTHFLFYFYVSWHLVKRKTCKSFWTPAICETLWKTPTSLET